MKAEYWYGRNTGSRDAHWFGVSYNKQLIYAYGKGDYYPNGGRVNSKGDPTGRQFRAKVKEKSSGGYDEITSGVLEIDAGKTDREVVNRVWRALGGNSAGSPMGKQQSSADEVVEDEDVPTYVDTGPRMADEEARKRAVGQANKSLTEARQFVTQAATKALNLLSILPHADEEELATAYRSIKGLRAQIDDGLEELDSYLEMFSDTVRNRVEETL